MTCRGVQKRLFGGGAHVVSTIVGKQRLEAGQWEVMGVRSVQDGNQADRTILKFGVANKAPMAGDFFESGDRARPARQCGHLRRPVTRRFGGSVRTAASFGLAPLTIEPVTALDVRFVVDFGLGSETTSLLGSRR